MNIDVFPHILPKKYFDRLLAVAPPELALQKRMSVIPVLGNLELRLTMSTVGRLNLPEYQSIFARMAERRLPISLPPGPASHGGGLRGGATVEVRSLVGL